MRQIGLKKYSSFNELKKNEHRQIKLTNPLLEFPLGSPDVFGTAAYWIYQWTLSPQMANSSGRDLLEESIYCMLGGYGMTAEVSNAYYYKITNSSGTLTSLTSTKIEEILRTPINLNGKKIKYRYPKMKSEYIGEAIPQISELAKANISPSKLRDELVKIRGIGLKTASWIIRNHFGSTSVAVVDIHLLRAGIIAGFLKKEWKPEKDYHLIENAYLEFCNKFNLSPGGFDLLLWNQMRLRRFKSVTSIAKAN